VQRPSASIHTSMVPRIVMSTKHTLMIGPGSIITRQLDGKLGASKTKLSIVHLKNEGSCLPK